jgi:hypothetical protein
MKQLKETDPHKAGRHAYMIGVDIKDNPYSKEPSHTWWEMGWIKESGRFIKTRFIKSNGR